MFGHDSSQCSHLLKNWHYNLQKEVSTVKSGQQPVTSKSTTTVYMHESEHSCLKLVNDTNIWLLAQLFLKQCFSTRSLSESPVKLQGFKDKEMHIHGCVFVMLSQGKRILYLERSFLTQHSLNTDSINHLEER